MNYTYVVCALESQTTTNKCKITIFEMILKFVSPVSIPKVVRQDCCLVRKDCTCVYLCSFLEMSSKDT